MNERFRTKNRLGSDTFKVIKKGARAVSGCIHMYFRPGPGPRLAVVAARKVANSVGRNKLKRWTREIFRRQKNSLKNYDIVVIYKKGADKYTYSEVKEILERIWQKEQIKK